MELGRSRHAGLAALLSALLPGLGQFYNRQWTKGLGFMVGVSVGFMAFSFLTGSLFGTTDPDQLALSGASVVPPEKPGRLFLIAFAGLVTLGVAIWSIVDAARTAKRVPSSQ